MNQLYKPGWRVWMSQKKQIEDLAKKSEFNQSEIVRLILEKSLDGLTAEDLDDWSQDR